jgi:hypothetical protein
VKATFKKSDVQGLHRAWQRKAFSPALDVVGRTVARVSVEAHMANYRAASARKVK